MIPQIMHKLSYYPWICSCIDTHFTISNDIKSESICMNEVPPKIWRLNQEKKCRAPDYSNEIEDDIFYYNV